MDTHSIGARFMESRRVCRTEVRRRRSSEGESGHASAVIGRCSRRGRAGRGRAGEEVSRPELDSGPTEDASID